MRPIAITLAILLAVLLAVLIVPAAAQGQDKGFQQSNVWQYGSTKKRRAAACRQARTFAFRQARPGKTTVQTAGTCTCVELVGDRTQCAVGYRIMAYFPPPDPVNDCVRYTPGAGSNWEPVICP